MNERDIIFGFVPSELCAMLSCAAMSGACTEQFVIVALFFFVPA